MTKRERRVSPAALRARQMMLGGAVSAHVMGVAVMALAMAVDGADALLTAALGFAAVVIFYGIGQFLEVIASELEPSQGLGLVLASYAVRVVGIAAGLWGVLSTPAVVPHVRGGWLVAGVTATVLAWVTGVVVVASRQRVPIYDEAYRVSSEGEDS